MCCNRYQLVHITLSSKLTAMSNLSAKGTYQRRYYSKTPIRWSPRYGRPRAQQWDLLWTNDDDKDDLTEIDVCGWPLHLRIWGSGSCFKRRCNSVVLTSRIIRAFPELNCKELSRTRIWTRIIICQVQSFIKRNDVTATKSTYCGITSAKVKVVYANFISSQKIYRYLDSAHVTLSEPLSEMPKSNLRSKLC